MTSPDTPCPCGSANLYHQCCQPLHLGQTAHSAEQLMRSRFSAFHFELWDYLYHTGPRNEDQQTTIRDLRRWSEDKTWLSLQVLDTHRGGAKDQTGTVEFVAFYRLNTPAAGLTRPDGAGPAIEQHHEFSQFKQIDGHWRFIEGRGLSPLAIGRNQTCPCGSGKKFKRCCYR